MPRIAQIFSIGLNVTEIPIQKIPLWIHTHTHTHTHDHDRMQFIHIDFKFACVCVVRLSVVPYERIHARANSSNGFHVHHTHTQQKSSDISMRHLSTNRTRTTFLCSRVFDITTHRHAHTRAQQHRRATILTVVTHAHQPPHHIYICTSKKESATSQPFIHSPIRTSRFFFVSLLLVSSFLQKFCVYTSEWLKFVAPACSRNVIFLHQNDVCVCFTCLFLRLRSRVLQACLCVSQQLQDAICDFNKTHN